MSIVMIDLGNGDVKRVEEGEIVWTDAMLFLKFEDGDFHEMEEDGKWRLIG